MDNWKSIYETALHWTLEAGIIIRESLGQQLHVDYKTSEADLVTDKDREIELFFYQKIKEKYPHHRILGEEGMGKETSYDPEQEIVWLIDPIDGTTSFVHQKENFAISVALYEKGSPRIGIIYDPIRDQIVHTLCGQGVYLNKERLEPVRQTSVKHSLLGINSTWLVPNKLYNYMKFHTLIQDLRGTRIIGAAALEMAAVATGKLNGFISLQLSPWDFAAGLAILQEMGVVITTIENKPVDVFSKTSIVAANETLHQEILQKYLEIDKG